MTERSTELTPKPHVQLPNQDQGPGEAKAEEATTTPPRVVLDTNVVIAAHLTQNPQSPTLELLDCWRAGEFVQLYSDDTLAELQEKFLAKGILSDATDEYIADLLRLGEHVNVAPGDGPVLTADPDDDLILACAAIGRADYIVTYDPHFDVLAGTYQGIPILDGLHFLYVVRGDRPTKT